MSPLRNKLLFSAAALAALTAASPDVWAAKIKLGAVVVEGTITDITGNIVTINSIPIDVSKAQIHTPTKVNLTPANLLTSMPGWDDPKIGRGPGLIGAHAVAQGNTSFGTTNGTMTALDLFTDMTENPIVGAATSLPPSGADPAATDALKVENVTMKEIPGDNGLMPGDPPKNIYGFEIFATASSIPVSTAVAVQGYYSDPDQALYYYSLQADSGSLKNPGTPEVSVTRALCQSGKLTFIGAAHTLSTGSVTIKWQGNNVSGNASATLVDQGVTNPTIGQYKWTGNAGSGSSTACPLTVSVSNSSTSMTAEITPK